MESTHLGERGQRGPRLGAHRPEALPPRSGRRAERAELLARGLDLLLLQLLSAREAVELEVAELLLERRAPLLVRRGRDEALDLVDLRERWPSASRRQPVATNQTSCMDSPPTCASTSTSSSLTAGAMEPRAPKAEGCCSAQQPRQRPRGDYYLYNLSSGSFASSVIRYS